MIPATMTSTGREAPAYFRLRSALSYCAPLIVNGIALPFFPLFLATLKFNDQQIGIILALPMVVRVLVAPVVALFADRMRERATVLLWSGGLSLLTAIALFWTDDFATVLLVYALQGATYAPYLPVVESITISGVRRWGIDYGSTRVWGSIAFIVSTLIGGQVIGAFGGRMVLPLMVIGFILTTVMALYCPRIGPTRRRGLPLDIKAPPIGNALRNPRLLLTMIGVSVQQASHALFYTFASIYWHQIGFSGTQVGILWSAGVAAEVTIFFLSKRLGRRFSAWTLMRFGAAMCVCRWIVFPMDLGFAGHFVLQCFHAFTYACVHIGVQRRIVATVQETQEASAQGVYFFYNGMCLGIATIASGYVYGWLGTSGFYLMALIAAAGLAMIVVASRLQPHNSESGGKTSEPS
ncbi:MFS transporter [Rhizobium tumorigenes]|uniref:MFS transporter n=1 Tax=Rhizobium tumorigenes TaxID=2041385 RepID=A0AAF1K6S0_9HYPH|nr:MFS transporter [Rhizobium tumorigenes]WFR97004.1 MFS transporter [Rhizobium tumorigenes]